MGKENFASNNSSSLGSDSVDLPQASFDLSPQEPKAVEAPVPNPESVGAKAESIDIPKQADVIPATVIQRPVSPELAEVRQQYSLFEDQLVAARGIKDPNKRIEAIARGIATLEELRSRRGALDGTIKPFAEFKKDQEIAYQIPGTKAPTATMIDRRTDPRTGEEEVQVSSFNRDNPDPAEWTPVTEWVKAADLRNPQPKSEAAPIEGPAAEAPAAVSGREAPVNSRYDQLRDDYGKVLRVYEADLLNRLGKNFLNSKEFLKAEAGVLAKVQRGEELSKAEVVIANLALLRANSPGLTKAQKDLFERQLQEVVKNSGAFLREKGRELSEGLVNLDELSKIKSGDGVLLKAVPLNILRVLDARKKLDEEFSAQKADKLAREARAGFTAVPKKNGDSSSGPVSPGRLSA